QRLGPVHLRAVARLRLQRRPGGLDQPPRLLPLVDPVVVPHHDVAHPEVGGEVVPDERREERPVHAPLYAHHLPVRAWASGRPGADPPDQTRPAPLPVRRVLDAPLPHGGVPVGRAHAREHPALIHAHHAGAIHAPLPRGERRALGRHVVAEPLVRSHGLFLRVSRIRASACPTVCWHTAGSPAAASRAASSCWGTEGSSSSHVRRRASPSGVTRRGFPPARGRRSGEPVARWSASQRLSEAWPTPNRSAMAGMEPSPRWYASTARRRRSREIAMAAIA